MSKFLHDDAKAIAIPPVFSENSRAENDSKWQPNSTTYHNSSKTLAIPRI